MKKLSNESCKVLKRLIGEVYGNFHNLPDLDDAIFTINLNNGKPFYIKVTSKNEKITWIYLYDDEHEFIIEYYKYDSTFLVTDYSGYLNGTKHIVNTQLSEFSATAFLQRKFAEYFISTIADFKSITKKE